MPVDNIFPLTCRKLKISQNSSQLRTTQKHPA